MDEAEVAHHEAGHAYAMLLFNRPFEHVTIVPGTDSLGHVLGRDGFVDARLVVEGCLRLDRTNIFDALVVALLAGPVAQARFKGLGRDFEGYAGHNDAEAAVRMIVQVSESEQEVLKTFDELLERTRVEVVWSDRGWREIERLAGELLAQRTLTHAMAAAMLS